MHLFIKTVVILPVLGLFLKLLINCKTATILEHKYTIVRLDYN